MMKNTKNDMPKMRSRFGVAKKSKRIPTRSTPGDERVDFWTVRGERGEDSSPFRLTSSLILHARYPGGVRRMKIDQKSSLGRPGCDCESFRVLAHVKKTCFFDTSPVAPKIRNIGPKSAREAPNRPRPFARATSR